LPWLKTMRTQNGGSMNSSHPSNALLRRTGEQKSGHEDTKTQRKVELSLGVFVS